MIWTLFTWSTRELEALASAVQAPGVSPLILGSSGMHSRIWNSFILKSSIGYFILFLAFAGIALKSWRPLTWKVCYLKFVRISLPFSYLWYFTFPPTSPPWSGPVSALSETMQTMCELTHLLKISCHSLGSRQLLNNVRYACNDFNIISNRVPFYGIIIG